MNRSDIQARAQRVPFRALGDQQRLMDRYRETIGLYLPQQRPDMVIVFDRSDRKFVLDVSQISAVESK